MSEQETKTLLIADDEDIICKPLRIFFERKGFFVVTASDGEEALQMLRTMKVDALIADLRMPRVGGLDLIRRAREHNGDLPCLVLSGAGSISDATEALHSGAFDYIQKPIINMDEMERIVRRAMEHSELERNQRILRKNLEEKTQKLEEKVKEINEAKDQLEKQSVALRRLLDMIEQQNLQMEEDLKSAQHIQEDLLPKDLPRGEHFTIVSRYIPSGKVAGDMFDAFFDPTYNIHLYVADVAGHGIGAAMVTVFLKKTITPFQHFTDINTTPREILSLLNEELIKAGFGRRLFVTMLYATFQPPSGKLTFASAGHTPLVLKRPGRDAEILNSKGISLGWQKNPVFEEKTLTLEKGDRLLFYTDGLTDAQNRATEEPCGLAPILELINSPEYSSLRPEDMLDGILGKIEGCCKIKDDVCLLTLSL